MKSIYLAQYRGGYQKEALLKDWPKGEKRFAIAVQKTECEINSWLKNFPELTIAYQAKPVYNMGYTSTAEYRSSHILDFVILERTK